MKFYEKKDIYYLIVLILFIIILFSNKTSPYKSYNDDIKYIEKELIDNKDFNNTKQIERVILYYAVFRRNYEACNSFYKKIPIVNAKSILRGIIKKFPKYKAYLDKCEIAK